MKTQLLASSPSLDGIGECIAKFYYRDDIELVSVNTKQWYVVAGEGIPFSKVRVIAKGKRFRFEMIMEEA